MRRGTGVGMMRLASVLAVVAGVLGCMAAPALAMSEGPGWELFANSYPTNFRAGGVDEVQEVTPNPGETAFSLTFEGEPTAAISLPTSAATIQSALESLTSIGKGGVSVEEEPGHAEVFAVTFRGLLGNMKTRPLEATGASTSVKTKGEASGTIGIDVFNVGAAGSHGAITVTDTLPTGIKAKEAGELRHPDQGYGNHFGIDPTIARNGLWICTGNGPGGAPGVAGASIVTCTNNPATLSVFQGGGGTPEMTNNEGLANPQPVIGIAVEAAAEASEVKNHVAIAGGGAPGPAATEDPVTVSSALPTNPVTQADAWFSNADGTVDTQAGAHPYTATFVFDTATGLNSKGNAFFPAGEIRDLETRVPPGFVGDLHNTAQCTRQQLLLEECPVASMVGSLKSSIMADTFTKQVFNIVPPPGVAAEVGFEYDTNTVYISFTVQTGSDYGIVAHVNNIPKKEVFQSILTLWGVPEEASHDRWRGVLEGGCTQEEIEKVAGFGRFNYCTEQTSAVVTPFLTLPTSCGAAQPFSFRSLNTWQDAAVSPAVGFVSHDESDRPTGFTGCESLVFEPTVSTSPDTAKGDTPAGLTVEVKPPLGGLEVPGGFGSADIEGTTVALPPGLVINPGQAAGLQECGSAEDGLTSEAEKAAGEENDGPATCPNASKIGTVVIKSPLIEADQEKQFEGDVYVLDSNPPELRLLVAASADGVNLKLVGETSLCEAAGEVLHGKTCEAPGQVITTFQGTPQLPFTLFKLSFSGGPQAALDTPTRCGIYTSEADFTPWNSPLEQDFLTNASFTISEGPNNTGCPSSPLPFSPTLTAGATTDKAGAFTGFSMLLQRADGQQRIERLQFKAPPGLSGMLSNVPLCGEAQANAGTCGSTSQIGHAVVTSGPGPYPLVLPQPGEPELPIYLTGPYKGAPFGLSIVTPVLAGPFNLGTIITRAKIEVDPNTAQITVTTDPLPQIVKGVPTDLRSVDAVIDRPGFMFNPSNCESSSFSGTAWGIAPPGQSEPGQAAAISSPFDVGSCRELTFTPKVVVSTGAHASKADGASLEFKISYPKGAVGTQAWFKEAKFDIPKQLPAELKAIQQACPSATFEANPAGCSPHAKIGEAVVHTPVLPVPLQGPIYFVSYGSAKFPDAVILLSGDNVNVRLTGETFINSKTNVTSATFPDTPDVPFESIEVTLPTGEYSEFGANLPKHSYDFCGQKLKMPTLLKAQNGLEIRQETPVTVTGCPTAKHHTKKHKHSNKHKK
jgi:hypothetical protein